MSFSLDVLFLDREAPLQFKQAKPLFLKIMGAR